ncbi:MAG: site-2 protease family protein [Kiritimatiellia bacterium]
MFGKGLRLVTLLGFEVRINASWLLLALLIILSLARGYFPAHYPDLGPGVYWLLGALGAGGLFVSIIIHELCHSLVARLFGISIKGISLFMFGGIAQMEEDPRTPQAEFLMALAGPAASLALSFLFYGLQAGLQWAAVPVPVLAILGYLAWMNLMLGVFNLIPAFPLDGGRVLRAMLWAWQKNLRRATRISSDIGSGFGLLLVLLGVFSILGRNVVAGIWWCLIGMFLRGISASSYQQVLIKETLTGEPVSRVMEEHPVTVPPGLTVEALVNDYIYRYHYKMFPVVDEGRLAGSVSTWGVKSVPREAWGARRVGEICVPCSAENTISVTADAAAALTAMNKAGATLLMVAQDERLAGIVSLPVLSRFLSLKLDLEGGGRREPPLMPEDGRP